MTTFDVSMLTKLKHGKLYKAAKKMGGQSALAKHLGITTRDAGWWCNMRACPPVCETEIRKNSKWTPERIRELERKLFELTDCLLEDLFPVELRSNQELLDSPKTQLITKQISTKQLASDYNARLRLPDPSDEAEKSELRERVANALQLLSSREQTIIQMRFGLGDDAKTYTLEEIAAKIKITRERVRQIEKKAIFKLGAFCPDTVVEF